jgi:hypothetical protein
MATLCTSRHLPDAACLPSPSQPRAAPRGVSCSHPPSPVPLYPCPAPLRRVWCLFEALTALSISREIQLLTDAFDSTAKVDTLLPLFTRVSPRAAAGSVHGM